MKVPGVLYSLILAIGVWVVEYFGANGAGSIWPLAPILLAAVPILLKLITVQTPEQPTATREPSGRGFDAPPAGSSRVQRFLLG